MAGMNTEKIPWRGTVVGVQPRIRLARSFDQRHHAYLGFSLRLKGEVAGGQREFLLGIGEGAQRKHAFQAGFEAGGECLPVADPRAEPVDFYKASGIEVLARVPAQNPSPPPWLGLPPALPVYRERGHRRLDTRTYDSNCMTCVWGCRMAVEMIIDQWNPGRKRYRRETFCYGPRSCPLYRPGPTRKVPGRKGMTWEEEDWIDEEATAHRGPDE